MTDLQQLVASANAENLPCVYLDVRGKVLGMSRPLAERLGYPVDNFDCTVLSFRDIDAKATLLSWRSLTKILRTTEEHCFRSQVLTESLQLIDGEICVSATSAGDRTIYRFDIRLTEALVGNAAIDEPDQGKPGRSIEVSEEPDAPAPPPARPELGLLWLTEFGVVRYADEAYLELSGYDREDLFDIEVDRLLHLQDLVLNWPDILRMLGPEQPTKTIPYVSYQTADGQQQPCGVELTYKQRTAARRSEYIELQLVEATELDLDPNFDATQSPIEGDPGDERLLLNEVLYRYTIQNSSVGVYWIRENSPTFLYCNEAFARITGYRTDELVDMQRTMIFPERVTAPSQGNAWDIRRGERSTTRRTYVEHRDGHRVPVQVSSTIGIYRGKALATVMVNDLTEQVTLEKQQRLSQFTLDASSFGVMWVRLSDWSILFANKALRKMVGREAHPAHTLQLSDFMLPDDRARLPQIARVLTEKKVIQVEGIYRHADGHEFPVRRTANLLEQDGEAVVALYVEDITAERRMQHQDQLVRNATDRAGLAACFVRESDNGTVYANQAFGHLLGYSLEEVLHLKAEEYLVSPGPDQWETTWKILHDTGKLDVEGIYRHRDGTKFPVFLRASYFEFEGEKVTSVYVEDLRPLKAAQRQLGLNQAAADDATLGIYYVQETGNEIVYANAKIAELLGYELSTLLTLTPHDFLLEPAPDTWDDAWQVLRENRQVDFEGLYKRSDGSHLPVRLHATYLEHDGRNLVSIYVEDLSELRTLENDLELNLAAVNQAKLGIYYVSPDDFSLHFANERMAELLGYAPEAFRRLNLLDFLVIESVDVLRAAFQRVLDEGFIVVERHYRHKDGHAVPVRLNINAVQFGDKQLAAVFVEDRQEFNEQQQRLHLQQLAVDQSQLGIYFCRRENFDIIYANQALGHLLGYATDELQGLHPSDILVEPAEINWEGAWEQVRQHTQVTFEAKYRHRDGYLIPVMLHCNYVATAESSVVVSYLVDLRPLQRAQQRLRIHEKAVEQANVGIFTANVGDLSVFDSVNHAMAGALGYTLEDLMATPTTDVIIEPPAAEWPAYMEQFRQTITASVPLKLKTKTGELRSGIAQVNYFTVDDQEFISVIAEDHTEADARELALNEALDENILLRERLESENILLREEIDQYFSLQNIITQSKKYQRILKQVEKVAGTDSTVLITGETGTGKELIANALHQYSKRSERVMTKVNCAALPESLIESELFGHEKGAFTGADTRKIGRFELADGGTLFLDEVGEMPLELQPKLLRVLQEGTFERVGSNDTIEVDVRVVAATNRNLKDMVRVGTFREDLYYRLHVFPIDNLPLRERKEDIPLLVQFFVDRYAKNMGRKITEIGQDSIDKLLQYPFPGNVRELENLVERSLVLHQKGPLKILLPD